MLINVYFLNSFSLFKILEVGNVVNVGVEFITSLT